MNLDKSLKKVNNFGNRKEPLWKGPQDKSDMGGITYSMLSGWLVDRERFRLKSIMGIRPIDKFNPRMEYGNLWHTCEEYHAKGEDWAKALTEYCRGLAKKYRTQQQEVAHWHNVCKTQFPHYINHYANQGEKEKVNLFSEEVFHVPYKLPSGRLVWLRGKWDSADLRNTGTGWGVWLQENKTKGDVDLEAIEQNMDGDLQTMMYLIALSRTPMEKKEIHGAIYNVVRRPLAGGKHSIRQHKATKNKPEETMKEFYTRLGGLIKDDPTFFFNRFEVRVSQEDLQLFRRRTLDPILEQLCDWYEYVTYVADPFDPSRDELLALELGKGNRLHWMHPYGVFNPINEGYHHYLNEFLKSGSTAGLEEVDTLFPELE